MNNLLGVISIALFHHAAGERFPFVDFNLTSLDNDIHMEDLTMVMAGYLKRADATFKEFLKIKQMVDTTSNDERISFEKGYVMGDIIETKAVVYTEKQMNKQRYLESERIRYLMYVQNAYIKVYHLVHMLHEINPKYGADNTGQMVKLNLNPILSRVPPKYYNTAGFNYAKQLQDIRDRLEKERAAKVKKESQIKYNEMSLHGRGSMAPIKATTNWWPLNYGWDIDYYW